MAQELKTPQQTEAGAKGSARPGSSGSSELGTTEHEVETGRSGWLSRWDPWREDPFGSFFGTSPFALFRRMTEDMDRLTHGGASPFAFGGRFAPQIEVAERDGKLLVRADLPGCSPEDFRVDVEENSLILSGERRSEHEQTRGGVHRSERTYGSFRRVIPLPPGANVDAAEANFQNGVLEISIPLPEQTKARRLEVRSTTGTTAEELKH
jgi:HSP20 family protein